MNRIQIQTANIQQDWNSKSYGQMIIEQTNHENDDTSIIKCDFQKAGGMNGGSSEWRSTER